jgi:iron(III) transport system permease protein
MTRYGYFKIDIPWTLNHWYDVWSSEVFTSSALNTLWLAGSTAACLLFVCVGLGYIIARTDFRGVHVLDILTWMPFLLPGILLSLTILWIVLGVEVFRPLYGSTFLLVLVLVLATMTMGVAIIKGNFVQLGRSLEEVSWLSGASWWRTMRRIIAPLAVRSLIVVGILGVVAGSRNIAHLALLTSTDNRPLAILQMELIGQGRYEASSIIGLIVAIATVAAALAARAFGLQFGAHYGARR